jgi:ribonuclease HI
MDDLESIIVYSDGACAGNPGPGGFAAILLGGGVRRDLSGGRRLTTSNRMEMMAPIAALVSLEWPSRVTIYSDSRYLVTSFMRGSAYQWRANGWKRTRKAYALNGDLWRDLLDLTEKHEIEFVWVPRRASDPDKIQCRQLAVRASRLQPLPIDEGYERQLARAKSQGLLFE